MRPFVWKNPLVHSLSKHFARHTLGAGCWDGDSDKEAMCHLPKLMVYQGGGGKHLSNNCTNMYLQTVRCAQVKAQGSRSFSSAVG